MTANEIFLNVTACFYWAVMVGAIVMEFRKQLKKREEPKKEEATKFSDYISKLAEEGNKLIQETVVEKVNRATEVHTFQWRHEGEMHEVKIIIDPSLDTIIPGTRSEFEQMLKSGDAGTFSQLLSSLSTKQEEGLQKVDKFIFSRKSVDQMRIAGMSPDELVVRMLKAAGRM